MANSPEPSSVQLFADRDCSVRLCTYPPHFEMPKHAHETHGVSVVLGGHVGEVVGSREEVGCAFSVVVKPASVAHQNRFGPMGAKILSMNLGASWFDDNRGLTDGFRLGAGARVTDWTWGHDGMMPLSPHLRRMLDDRRSLTALDVDALVAACLAATGADGPAHIRQPPRWLLDVRDRLHDEFASPPSARELAEQAGVHRVHLVRSFQQHFGLPPAEYTRRLRLREASTRLAMTSAGLAAVAVESGFSDQSHLGRRFRRATGLTPARFRAAVRA